MAKRSPQNVRPEADSAGGPPLKISKPHIQNPGIWLLPGAITSELSSSVADQIKVVPRRFTAELEGL
jgi:hypothetical protein